MTTPGIIITDRSEATPAPTRGDTVIGIVGTAPDFASAAETPVNVPVLVQSQDDHSVLWGNEGNIPAGLDAVKDNVSDQMVVVRIPDEGSEAQYSAGLDALLSAQSELGVSPSIIVPLGATWPKTVAGTSAAVGNQLGTAYKAAAASVSFTDGTDEDKFTYQTGTGGDGQGWYVPDEPGAAGDAYIRATQIAQVDAYMPTGFRLLDLPAIADNAAAIVVARRRNLASGKYVYSTGSAIMVLTVTVTETDDASSVVAKASAVAAALDGVAIVDMFPGKADDSNQEAVTSAIAWAGNNYQAHAIGVGPRVIRTNIEGERVASPLAPYIAGALARHDAENPIGFAASPQGVEVRGVGQLERRFTWTLSSTNLEIDQLVGASLMTLVRHTGYNIWGSRLLVDPTSVEPERFVNVLRQSEDISRHIEDTSFTYFTGLADQSTIDRVVTAVNGYLSALVAIGAITEGVCSAPPALNTDAAKAAGLVYFRVQYVPKFPVQVINFDKVIRTTSL